MDFGLFINLIKFWISRVLGNDVILNDTYLWFSLFYYFNSVISWRDVTFLYDHFKYPIDLKSEKFNLTMNKTKVEMLLLEIWVLMKGNKVRGNKKIMKKKIINGGGEFGDKDHKWREPLWHDLGELENISRVVVSLWHDLGDLENKVFPKKKWKKEKNTILIIEEIDVTLY